MKCYIIGSSPYTKIEVIKKIKKQKDDIIICSDGGVDFAVLANIKPDIVAGDFDSTKDGAPPKGDYEVIRFPAQKDYTDTRLCVDIALEKGYTDFEIYGCTSGRFDHMFANVLILLMLYKKGCAAKMVDHEANFYFAKSGHEFLNKNATVSFFSISENVEGLVLEGFRYPLKDYVMSTQDPLGISNVVIKKGASATFKKGYLFVVEYFKAL